MDQVLFVAGGMPVTMAAALVTAALLAVAVIAAVSVRSVAAARRQDAEQTVLLTQQVEERVAELGRLQSEMAGRVHSMGELLAHRQVELERTVGDRLDSATHRLGQSMAATAQTTSDSLRTLHERLALIDNAQKSLTELTTQVTSLREVLSNKQARGAFGQGRMEAIIRDGLPSGAYEFQFTLKNNLRPDCVIFFPDERPLVVDAKFPLEAFSALRDAKSEDERKRAGQRLRQDIAKHVADVARYLVPGETQDTALLFVPSESVYAELHDGFDDVVQKAYRARVVLVSPSLLMLAIQVIQQIQKDAHMREAAHLIQTEVGHLAADLGRLRDRVFKLQNHFGQANEDVRQILVSAEKIERRSGRIQELDFGGETAADAPEAMVIPAPIRRLRVGE
jgi:DNA recombination protein RmuC